MCSSDLLGVFLLGVLTKRANESGAMIGLVCGIVVSLFLWLGPKFGLMTTVVAWTWYVTIGTTLTFVIGYFTSMLFPVKTSAAKSQPERVPARA